MKKYLMTGMAALAICAAFTSCSKETNVYNPDQPKEDIKLSYDQAFVKVFGQPAYDQDWGFGTAAKARTRDGSTYMNGNMEKYKDAPTLKENEDAEITAYVRQLTEYPHVAPTNLETYFVKQVHCGTEYYTNADGGAGILGSSKMNNLHIAMQEGGVVNEDGSLSSVGDWIHINNFNRGDNTDWNGNTLVENGGTFNFAYHGAEDSQYHDRWISVKGSDVDAYYNALGTYSGAKYAGFYYICFDFEATIGGPTNVSNIRYYDPVLKKYENSGNITIPGAYTEEQLLASNLKIAIPVMAGQWPNQYVERYVNVTINSENIGEGKQIESLSYSNILNGNMLIEGNNKYDDWIIRLVEAEPKNTDPDPEYSIRVIGEDLTFGEDLDTDFDFNDVVFDVALNVPNKTFIKVKAAGGTLPLIIGVASPQNDQEYNDYEVHHLFGFTNTSVMINTNATAAGLNGATANDAILELTTTYTNARDIPVYVKKNGVWCELTAQAGEPASKIGISNMDFRWCDERVSLKTDYPLFTQWVEATAEFRSQITWW